jgi:hypothetical protein
MTTTTIKNQPPTTNNLTNVKEEIQTLLAPYITLDVPNPLDPSFVEPIKYGNKAELEMGKNIFRILSEGIVSCEYWIKEYNEERQEVRSKAMYRPLEQAATIESEYEHCYSYFVWNYKAQRIQIFHSTKKGVNRGLDELIKDRNWGDPTEYDISINKTQSDPSSSWSVKYSVNPKPKAVLDPEIAEKWNKSGFNRHSLYLIFADKDPFEVRKQLKEQELTRNLRVSA